MLAIGVSMKDKAINTTNISDNEQRIVDEVRRLVEHENTVINYRIGWLIALQGLLFAGFGALYPKSTVLAPEVKHLLMVFPCTGIALAFVTLLSLIASATASKRLLRWWEENKPNSYRGPGISGWHMPAKWAWPHYCAPWNFIPIIIGCAWSAVLWLVING
jgi:hypothetical protein